MQAEYFVQPFDSEGKRIAFEEILKKEFAELPPLSKVWLVSAFAKQKGVLRLIPSIISAVENKVEITIIVGIDIQGTSKEALELLLKTNTKVIIFKNATSQNTFHPKFFLFETEPERATLFVGSVNLTNGGLSANYELLAKMKYDLKNEKAQYEYVKKALLPFLAPSSDLARPLTTELIQYLFERGDILSENELKATVYARKTKSGTQLPSPFKRRAIPSSPLPKEVVSYLLKQARPKTRNQKEAEDTIEFDAFYMELNKIQGQNIPGEIRIPMAARDVCPSFWGWPIKYKEIKRERGKKIRRYFEWKPNWCIIDGANLDVSITEHVRIYEYPDSMDFRFYSHKLVEWGADEGDIIRVTKGDSGDKFAFKCELAKKDTPAYVEWLPFCSETVKNSNRKFGFI